MSKRPSKSKESANNYFVGIKVVGIGGGGGNAVSRMKNNLEFRNIEFIAINTDIQDLNKTDLKKKIHIGKNLTRGLGTGMNPDLGRQAAEENRSEIVEAVKGADLVFVTAGLGGGTGSGAAPIIAEVAKEQGALTVAIVTRPFQFEGTQRARVAEDALMKLKEKVDALVVIPNDRIFNIIKKETPIIKAFERIDDVLRDAVAGIAELIASVGIINVDFADVKTIMKDAGAALIGVGAAAGQNRAATAATQALNSPLLEFSIEGARGVLFGVSGGRDLKMNEVNEIAKLITATIDPSARVIFGTYHDRKMRKGNLKVTLIATGFNSQVLKSTAGLLPLSGLFSGQEKEQKSAEFELPLKERGGDKKSGKDDRKEKASEKKSDEMWDIPAFFRKKRR